MGGSYYPLSFRKEQRLRQKREEMPVCDLPTLMMMVIRT